MHSWQAISSCDSPGPQASRPCDDERGAVHGRHQDPVDAGDDEDVGIACVAARRRLPQAPHQPSRRTPSAWSASLPSGERGSFDGRGSSDESGASCAPRSRRRPRISRNSSSSTSPRSTGFGWFGSFGSSRVRIPPPIETRRDYSFYLGGQPQNAQTPAPTRVDRPRARRYTADLTQHAAKRRPLILPSRPHAFER